MDKSTFLTLATLALGAGVTLILTLAAYFQGRKNAEVDGIRSEAKKRINAVRDALERGDDAEIQRMAEEAANGKDNH